MKVIDKIHFLIASICLLYTTGISSQNMTTSPYSMFGIGELTDGQTITVAGTELAHRHWRVGFDGRKYLMLAKERAFSGEVG